MRRIQLIFIELQLPTLVEQPPRGEEWIHEIKQDGYRTLFVVEDGRARAYTGTGLDWIVQDERGASDFDALMSAIRWRPHKLIFYAFDLLHLERALLMRPEQFLQLRATFQRWPDFHPVISTGPEECGLAQVQMLHCAAGKREGRAARLLCGSTREGLPSSESPPFCQRGCPHTIFADLCVWTPAPTP
jgi:hypothetical protein